tara:strand:+ start:2198 stop:2395 length:198 start_codon:yes stop_codon:yes gene_type:complete
MSKVPANLFCPDQKVYSEEGRKNYDATFGRFVPQDPVLAKALQLADKEELTPSELIDEANRVVFS